MQIEELYKEYKALLFSIGYGMLGTVEEAEDIVQDVFLTLQAENLGHISDIKAYLCKMASNRSIDVLRSAQKKRLVYVGEWLPEPLTSQFSEVENVVENRELLSIVYLKLMESLSPNERAAFLLKEGFHLSHAEIAAILDTNEVNSRKLYSRAKKKMELGEGTQFTVKENQKVIEGFIHAFEAGAVNQVLAYMSPDVILYSDGGGIVKAAIRPIETSERVLAFLFGIYQKRPENFTTEMCLVNGHPGVMNKVDQQIQSIITFNIERNRVKQIFIMMNPEKLKNV